eukprot:Gb_01350 [translate_table: standard]
MESTYWGELPEDIVDRILARLPPHKFLQVRCVCRRWNALLSSPAFLALCAETQNRRPWLLMFNKHDTRRVCRAYDILSRKWRIISLSFVPYEQHHLQLVATSPHLLCFSTPFSSLLLCNPLTRDWTPIPPSNCTPHRTARPAVSMASTASHEYVILIVSHNAKSQIYTSATQLWRTPKQELPADICLNLSHAGTYCNGNIYFATSDEPFRIWGYSLRQSVWSALEAPMPDLLTCARLVCCKKNTLYLVGGVGSNGIAGSIWVWEMVRREGRLAAWRAVEKVPDLMCRKFLGICYHNYEHIWCCGHRDWICISCYTGPHMLLFRLSRRTWHWLPRCPLISDKSNSGFSCFSFTPALFAHV